MASTHTPSSPACPITEIPGALPTCAINEDVDPLPIAQASLIHLQLLDAHLLTDTTLWRDLFALTGTARTINGVDSILKAWKELKTAHKAHEFALVPGGVQVMRPTPTMGWIQAKFTFKTSAQPPMSISGIMRLVPDEEQQTWKLWNLITMLQGIDGFPNVDVLEPAMDWQSEAEQLLTPVSDFGEQTIHDCVIVGAGMSGLCTAGYLKAVGINAVILERNKRVGQNWTDRYDSVKIHTSRSYGQLPFEPPIWGPEYPYHLNIQHLDEGYQKYVKRYNLDVWLSTSLDEARWSKVTKTWTLSITRRGMRQDVHARHLVLAIGGGGQVPKMPELDNRNAFKGKVLHSAEYKNSKAWKGLKGVVIGTANSGHDVANDMLGAGLESVTMIQRGRTPVLPIEYYHKIYDHIYNDKIPVAVSDALSVTMPTAISRLMAIKMIGKFSSEEPERFDALERRGFRVERCMDLYQCLYERFGGHYIDVGVSNKIGQGLIKVKGDAPLTGFTESGLKFGDGSTLDADVVVFATGFEGNMRLAAADLVGQEVGDKLDDWWGVDSEGELRGAWKPIGHPGIWFTGGNVGLARFFSRFLALQIAADVKGMPLQVYSKTPQ
ncbi:FAD/NAD(P)-binding domain-containing protein [Tothia fuscella]|uniref:FAD/NAD(P)-binding domain-containing protein n=1 Tax=Tothia fuscella TaxID=1048955 RepID=A0A9P4NPG9_9PEZI|nr:FAD/NAD(P)-binding domain-containing protein [Tothia fuscella]